jgi:autotransporter adhesin
MIKKISGFACLGVIALIVIFAATMGIAATAKHRGDFYAWDPDNGWVESTVEVDQPVPGIYDKKGFEIVSQSAWNAATKVNESLADEPKKQREAEVAIYKIDHKVDEIKPVSQSTLYKRTLRNLDLKIKVAEAQRDEKIRKENVAFANITDPTDAQKEAHNAAIQAAKDTAEVYIASYNFAKKAAKSTNSDVKFAAFQAGWDEFISHFHWDELGFIVIALGVGSFFLLKQEKKEKAGK